MQTQESMQAALKTLSEEQRQVVRLSFFADRPHSEIAETLNLPRAALTATMQNLEAFLGTKLLLRTTRRLSLTPDGADYFRQCVEILGAVEAAEAGFRGASAAKPKGKLRIDLPGTLGRRMVMPRIAEFSVAYPEVELVLSLTDRIVDRAGEVMPEDATSLLRSFADEVVHSKGTGAIIFGLIGAVWSASSAIGSAMKGLNRAYDVKEDRGFVRRKLVALALTVMFTCLLIAAALLIGTGQIMAGGIVLTYRNISKEMALARLKSDFVANVSHELRTPLSLIRLYAETLEMGRLTSPEKYQEYYRIMRKESERLTALINNILDFSRIEAGRIDASVPDRLSATG